MRLPLFDRRCIARAAVLAALLALAHLPAASAGDHAAVETREAGCDPHEGLNFICGPEGSEDLVALPGALWLIASGLNLGHPAHLYLIDTRSKRASVGFPSPGATPPSAAATSHCPGPPDLSRMSTDGLGLRAGAAGVHTLYAANHGDRLAIEMFRVDARGARPKLEWQDCALLPPGTLPNAVVPLPDEGLLVTTFYDPTDRAAWQHMARGERTGRILTWRPAAGFRTLTGSEMSGANGLETSRDGRLVYASAWSARKLVVLSLEGGERREIALDFMPDNIHRLEDGSLLVGGQRTEVLKIAACGAGPCPQPWVIARVDPRSGAVRTLLTRDGSPQINYACGGLSVNREIYLTARGSRAIAYVRADPLTDAK